MAPAKLNSRHHLLAYLLVAGKSDTEAAEALGYSTQRICQIKKSPLFTVLLGEVRDELREKHITNVAGWLEEQTEPTLKRLAYLRDQDDSLPVAATVSMGMLDRIAPKISKSESETIHRHVWDRRDISMMARVLAEDQGQSPDTVDAEFKALDDAKALPAAQGTDEAQDAGVPSLDELLGEMEGER